LVRLLAPALVLGTWLPTAAMAAIAASAPQDFSGAYRAAAADAASASSNCSPVFVPGVATESTAHIVMGREVMVIVNEADHTTRRVYINGRHPANLPVTPLGHAIGWWEGDTLVVETVGLASGFTVVERMRKVNEGRTLEVFVNGRAARAELHPELRYTERACQPKSATDAGKDEKPAGTVPGANAAGAGGGTATAAVAATAAHRRPDFEGVWRITRPVRMLRTAEGRAPPLQPEARKLYQHRTGLFNAGKAAEFNGSDACVPQGEPRTPHGGQLFDIVQGDEAVYFGYTWDHMLRLAYFADAVPAQLPPSYHGSWAAHWDGDALVLEGGSFRADSLLDAAGLPHSDALHLTQRLSLGRGGHDLAIRTTIEDPKSYTRIWSTLQHYTRSKDAAIESNTCIPRTDKD
jgi:hypothetical protein